MTSDVAGWRAKVVFDRALYDRLNEETGGAGPDIINALLSVAETRKRAMIAAARAGQGAELARVAHTAKSGARSLGLLRLADLCDMIEHMAPGNPEKMPALCPDIEREFNTAVTVMEALQQE